MTTETQQRQRLKIEFGLTDEQLDRIVEIDEIMASRRYPGFARALFTQLRTEQGKLAWHNFMALADGVEVDGE